MADSQHEPESHTERPTGITGNEERAWNKNVTLWQAGLATFSMLLTLGGLLLAGVNKMGDINMQLHDLNAKLLGYEKVQERVTSLESWRWQHTIEYQNEVASLLHLNEQWQRHEDRLQDLTNKLTALQTSAQDRNRDR